MVNEFNEDRLSLDGIDQIIFKVKKKREIKINIFF